MDCLRSRHVLINSNRTCVLLIAAVTVQMEASSQFSIAAVQQVLCQILLPLTEHCQDKIKCTW